MSDINLLPPQMRKKEAKEKQKKQVSEIKMSYPEEETKFTKEKKKEGPSFFQKLKYALAKKKQSDVSVNTALPKREKTAPHPEVKKKKKKFELVSRIISRVQKMATKPSDAYQEKKVSKKVIGSPKEVKPVKEKPAKEREVSAIETISSKSPKPQKKEEQTTSSKEEHKFFIPKKLRHVKYLAINLIPKQLFTTPEKQVMRKGAILVYLIVFLVLIYGISWGLLELQESRTRNEILETSKNIDSVKDEIQGLESDMLAVSDFASRLQRAETLLQGYNYWTHFFNALERYTIEGISYRSVRVDKTLNVSLDVVAKDYDILASQMLIFENAKDFIQDFSFSDIKAVESKNGDSQVELSLSLKLVDGFLKEEL